MATDKTIRDALQDVIARELHEKWDGNTPPMDIIGPCVRQTGLRRAVWNSLSPRMQTRVLNAAMKQAKAGPIAE